MIPDTAISWVAKQHGWKGALVGFLFAFAVNVAYVVCLTFMWRLPYSVVARERMIEAATIGLLGVLLHWFYKSAKIKGRTRLWALSPVLSWLSLLAVPIFFYLAPLRENTET